MNNFLTRSISAIIYAALFIFAILFSPESYIILLTLFAGVCIWEFLRIIKSKQIIPFIALLVLSIYAYIKSPLFEYRWILLIINLCSLTFLLFDLFLNKLNHKHQLVKFLSPINYLVLSFFFLILLPFINNTYHPNIIIFIILIIWTNDSFAYLVGKNFGKTKLFESISPKKTIEGFIGGLIFSIIVGYLIGYFSGSFTIINWIIIALITSIFGTYGDLIESKFKRQANIKDSGTIMPGHGGLLDRLDSLFFLAPFVYLYIHFLM